MQSTLLYDGHGSTRQLMGSNGSVTSHFNYDAYGQSLNFKSELSNPAETSMLYSGEAFDPGLQMQYLRARYYNQAIGSFASLDGYGGNKADPQSLHKYAYVHGNPINGIDPTGMSYVQILAAVMIMTILAVSIIPLLPNPKEYVTPRARRTWRSDNRGRFINLSMFDERGREILGHWLNGTGEDMIRVNGAWGDYMKANKMLSDQLKVQVGRDAISRTNSGIVNIRFHADIENGYFTGYEMLHGSNANVGDFTIIGLAEVNQLSPNEKIVNYKLTYTWNDIIDPNPTYRNDMIYSKMLNSLYDPVDYNIRIEWDAESSVRIKNNVLDTSTGYPF